MMTAKNKLGWGIVVAFICVWGWYALTNVMAAMSMHDAGPHEGRWSSDGACASFTNSIHWDWWTGAPAIFFAAGMALAAAMGVMALLLDVPKKEPLPKAIVVEGSAMVDKCAE